MIRYTSWKFAPKFKWANKYDPTWWVDSTRGHRSHCLIGVNLIDVNSGELHCGQELHVIIFRLRISLMTRFNLDAIPVVSFGASV